MHHVSNFKIMLIGILFSLTVLACAHTDTFHPHEKKSLKYIFYFIGDGMAGVQVHATEAYRAALQQNDEIEGGIKAAYLAFSKFPVLGMQTTFANNRLITGSAAAGTALACGMKTNINMIAQSPDLNTRYTSIAAAAKANGMKVGILSSVPINHATPAAFYAHTESRKNFHDIAMQLANSNFDFFGGGYWAKNSEAESGGTEKAGVINGFTITHTLTDLMAQTPGTRVIAFDAAQDASAHTGAMNYELDRAPNHISLAQLTKEAVRLLTNPKGFFMMVEGGKIDWACHANDARSVFEDIIAFDRAVEVAAAFAAKHPDETLIVVTADHETGGLTIGHNDTKYDTAFEVLANQTVSHEKFDMEVVPSYQSTHIPVPDDIDADMWRIIFASFGLDGDCLTPETTDDVTEKERIQLEEAFDTTFASSGSTDDKGKKGYAKDTELGNMLLRILSNHAGLGWGTHYHTAVPVPVFAMGASAEIFGGYYDNTDIPKKMANALGVSLGNNAPKSH